jgi:Txe/YoeB family toxin of Txe-Axe toxin-antitoxin module
MICEQPLSDLNTYHFWHLLSSKSINAVRELIESIKTTFGLVIGFIEHLQKITTNNWSAIANSHILQFPTARTKSSQSPVSSLVVAW